MYLPAAGDDSPVQKISDVIEGRESRLFRETPAGFALTYTGMITPSGRYAEALAGLGLKPGDGVGSSGLRRMLGWGVTKRLGSISCGERWSGQAGIASPAKGTGRLGNLRWVDRQSAFSF
jgi:hypothetical protein